LQILQLIRHEFSRIPYRLVVNGRPDVGNKELQDAFCLKLAYFLIQLLDKKSA
jgi:hypothetical protein